MRPKPTQEGLKSEPLRAALTAALAGKPAQLEDLFSRYGVGHGAKPNLRLAAAFGAEIGALPGTAAPLLDRLGGNDAAPDTPEVFLPIAAAHGWVGRLRADREKGTAWAALALLAGDERGPVRVGTLDALTSFATRPGGADALLAEATEWLAIEDREISFGASGVAVEVFMNRQALAALGDAQALLDYLSQAIASAAGASRAAERSDARRRLLLALSRTLPAAVIACAARDRGPAWLEIECREARHPDVRAMLSTAILNLGDKATGAGATLAERLRLALTGSAKPPRDPTRIRKGSGRGKSSRPMR
jgi:hypothetical protein